MLASDYPVAALSLGFLAKLPFHSKIVVRLGQPQRSLLLAVEFAWKDRSVTLDHPALRLLGNVGGRRGRPPSRHAHSFRTE